MKKNFGWIFLDYPTFEARFASTAWSWKRARPDELQGGTRAKPAL